MNPAYDDDYAGSSYTGHTGSYAATSAGFLETENWSGDDDSEMRPRILMMGARRAGKSSIQKVVFHKMSPHETLFLESTTDVRVKDISTSAMVQFQLMDFPGNFDFDAAAAAAAQAASAPTSATSSSTPPPLSPERIFRRPGVVVFVIDAQDDETHPEAIEHFLQIAKMANAINANISFDILIHKVDGDSYLSNDHKADCQQEIQQQITDELQELDLTISPNFHLTSIYDHSIFEAFSKIVQNLIPQLAMLENLLDGLIASCGIEKAFLFDVVSKIYVATDSNPVDMQTYELCSDMIDVVIDVSCIYGVKGKSDVLAYDVDSAAVIKLSNNYVLYLREVNRYLALVCLMPADSFAKAGLVDYNVMCLKNTIAELCQNRPGRKAAAVPLLSGN